MMPWLGRGLVERSDDEALRRQTRRFQMWRPWMWGPLGARWQIHYELITVDTFWGPSRYLWKDKGDREVDKDVKAAWKERHEHRD